MKLTLTLLLTALFCASAFADILVYREGSFLKAINDDGKQILSVYGASEYKVSNKILAYREGSFLKAVNSEGVQILSVYGASEFDLSQTQPVRNSRD